MNILPKLFSLHDNPLHQRPAKYFCKGSGINILDFVGYVVSLKTGQMCKMNGHFHVPINFLYKNR